MTELSGRTVPEERFNLVMDRKTKLANDVFSSLELLCSCYPANSFCEAEGPNVVLEQSEREIRIRRIQ